VNSDSDIVRLTSQWPGAVADIFDYAASLEQPEISFEWVGRGGRGNFDSKALIEIFSILIHAGIFESIEGEKFKAVISRSELFRLSQMLRGAEHFRRLKLGGKHPEIAVTMPMSPSHLEQQLSTIISTGNGFVTTRDAFFKIARSSRKRFLIMTPYIDKDGFAWLKEIFSAVKPDIKKILILREASKYAVTISMEHSKWLNDFNITVMDYHIASRDRSRALAMETFHAKVVLGDDVSAYVGSANLLGTGEGTSLEVGVTFEDFAASQVAKIIDGILRVARKLN
jgi:hypothetical protein